LPRADCGAKCGGMGCRAENFIELADFTVR
jgi:hypothetical protein